MKSLKVIAIFLELLFSIDCVIFDCDYQQHSWYVIGDVYTCHATVEIPNESRALTEVSQNHHTNKTDLDVLALSIEESFCPFIPFYINRFFPNLLSIRFMMTELKVLNPNDLRMFPALKLFVSYYNPVKSIDGNLFRQNRELEFVSFPGNQLKHVGHNLLLQGLDLLNYVFFDNNICINYNVQLSSKVSGIISMLQFRCPSIETFQLIENEIIEGEKFEISVRNLTNQLEMRISHLENLLNSTTKYFEEKIHRLEQRNITILKMKILNIDER